MKHQALLIYLLVALGFATQTHASSNQATSQLHALFEEDWQARVDRSPMLSTRMGFSDKNHLLQDVSEAAYQAWADKSRQFLEDLKKINYQALAREDQINYQIFQRQLERRISEIEYQTYQIPFLSDSGFHTSIMRMHTSIPLKNIKDYQNYLERLKAVPEFFAENQRNMEKGLARGYSMPKVVMKGFTDVILAAYEKGWQDSAFWKVFESMPESFNQNDAKKLKAEAKVVIKDKLIPAFKALYDFFENTYIPKTKQSLGAYDFPNGKAYYGAQIDHYTTLALSADEIHQIGLNEVKRIRSEMETVIKQANFDGSFKAFLKFLRESPQFYAKTAQDLIIRASYLAKKADGQLPKLFTKLPRQPYAVEPVPDAIAPKYTTGRYLSAPLDSERPGVYWVNTYALDKRPLYVLEALTLHEAVPGHHLQNALNQELTNVPNFRRYSYISAFGEGWGLYSERLGLEMGFYEDPYSEFGRLSYEMWRAARLVIDTGIHAKGWSREQAIELLEENSALSTHNIRTEVDRYISWPGQALSYKLGEIKILELRKKAEKMLGEKFDIRLFHDAILQNGSVPLPILEQEIDRFIKHHQMKKATN
ncbi:DUF885 domain-containing protein [Aliikangiella marina]|uniref:DUF885 domain-containing protein n=1 Tax=Aliikangiella marina TaxID=1712262 RepID=A0A545T3B1_9GAMM|nr:DUF885 domain-containing protein [Aliikangiella marina]TQV71660.1 DUF885 domain-containing protein [Aliikangiella marina]TQV71675.1 DUF885 domain-containing protein [Aliikangiella marina]